MHSKSHANKYKFVTFLIPEHRQARVAHQRHQISSEKSQKSYMYWNLHAVVMSDCSFIATRNLHAKHKKSVGRILRGAEHRQAKEYYAKDYKRSCFGSERCSIGENSRKQGLKHPRAKSAYAKTNGCSSLTAHLSASVVSFFMMICQRKQKL